ncbi:MAG: ribulose-phosphate 3-epimerase [Saprospiraceae bacterium]|nr:ribulose-phosphate 3-epimerase [Saprospiraceae bacterium]MCB9319928.1 ribulose-phosphate 3-epimerase [Lewinellaceae bacterium]
MTHLIAPSILAADFTRLGEDIQMLQNSEADWVHVDVMDGRFVPNISFGMMIVKAIRPLTTKPLDVHLMIVEPEKYIDAFREAGADHIIVHYEACPHLHRTIQQIKESGASAGVAINPHTPVALLEDILEDLDQVLIMSVNPGFGGQKFIYQSLKKIEQLKYRLLERNLKALISIDGGVGLHNAGKILEAGCNVLVAGSTVFKAPDPTKMIAQLKHIGRDALLA